jgi:Fur family ferric uptake transcriptional regulator
VERIKNSDIKRRNSTRQKKILNLLRDQEAFLSSQEIHKLLQQQGESVGLATVYRQLEALTVSHVVDSIINLKGEKLYRHCGQADSHHHHIICRICGNATELDSPEVENLAKLIAKRYDYKEVTHSLELFGICSSCSAIQSSSIKSKRKPKLS